MFSLNKAMIVGNLTRDPDLRTTPTGKSVCSFGVATNRRWKDQNNNLKEETEFHEVVAWGKPAEIISQFLKKGHKVYIEGRLRTRQWEGQDGVKRQRTEIIMENFIPLTPKGTSAQQLEEIVTSEIPDSKDIGEEIETKSQNKKGASAEKDIIDKEEIDLDEIPF